MRSEFDLKGIDYQKVLAAINQFNTNPDCRQSAYDRVINNIKATSVENLNIFEMEKICWFLTQWMVPGVERIDRDELLSAIMKVKEELNILRGQRIMDINFVEHDEIINKCFNSLWEVYGLGPTSVSKVLHLLAPDLFVMWDKYIAAMYKIEWDTDGYVYKLLPRMQKLLKTLLLQFTKDKKCSIEEAEQFFRERANSRTLAKIIDEYNWILATGRHYFLNISI